MKLHLKKNQLHEDVGKAPGAKITEADIAKEKAKGGVFAKRAQFTPRRYSMNHYHHPVSGFFAQRDASAVGAKEQYVLCCAKSEYKNQIAIFAGVHHGKNGLVSPENTNQQKKRNR